MGHRGNSAFRGRPYGPDPFGRDAQNRVRIAQTAARLIAEHGITDWSLAKRKAARQLMLSEREALPDDGEIEAALVEHHALFGGEAHVAALRRQREQALLWMRRLATFEPALVGGVAAGWATEHSDIRVELVADDAKTVELALINGGVTYRLPPPTRADAPTELYIDTPAGGLRLIVRSATAQRQRPQRDAQGQPVTRLSIAALELLLT
ncbi:MAG TPA: hypothetical protein VIX61_02920 [Casimicrobiaceae bacterium]